MKTKTAFITGSSRGIGKAIALKLAKEGYNIVVASKTNDPHPTLEGTIHQTAQEVEALGVKALPLVVDIRSEEMVQEAVTKAVETFGGIDVLVNNASAISLRGIERTSMKRYDLMHEINVRGTFMVSKHCIPHLKKSDNPHILSLAPPINLDPKWFSEYSAYTMSKYGMSMTVIGQAAELKQFGIASNGLWPQTIIATAAISNVVGDEKMLQACRKPSIMADAALEVIKKDSKEHTGNFFIDEEVLKEEGVTDFDQYAVNSKVPLIDDLFL